jgi:hypothetical protein
MVDSRGTQVVEPNPSGQDVDEFVVLRNDDPVGRVDWDGKQASQLLYRQAA